MGSASTLACVEATPPGETHVRVRSPARHPAMVIPHALTINSKALTGWDHELPMQLFHVVFTPVGLDGAFVDSVR